MRNLLATVTAALLLAGAGAAATAHAQLPAPQPSFRLAPTVFVPLRTPLVTSSGTTTAPAPQPGRLTCAAVDNGAYAPASVQIRAGGRLVASGSCASPIQLPAGTYDAAVTLESALDRPVRTVRVVVPAGGVATARASFETALLEVRFTSARTAVHGLAIIERDGVVVGTLGSGVTGRLSAGTYTIVARYRTAERRYTVALAPGQRRALRADF